MRVIGVFSRKSSGTYLKTEANLDFILIDNYNIVISKRINPLSNFITQKLEEVVITNYLTKGISRKSDGNKTTDFFHESDLLQLNSSNLPLPHPQTLVNF